MAKKKKTNKNKKARSRRGLKAFLICLCLFGLLALFTRLIVFVPVHMNSNAMAPGYLKGDVVYANKLALWKDYRVSRGDVLLTRYSASGGSYIRRVAGVPGDLIDVRGDGKYLVERLEDGSVLEVALGDAPGLVYGELPEGAYLMLADQLTEENAPDSRTLGLVFETEIKGCAGVILWPVSRMFRGN